MYDVTETRLYGMLTIVPLAPTMSIGFFAVRAFVTPEVLVDSLTPNEKEVRSLSSVQYAIKTLLECDIPSEEKPSVQAQLRRALKLVMLQHDLERTDEAYGNIDDKLLVWCGVGCPEGTELDEDFGECVAPDMVDIVPPEEVEECEEDPAKP